MEHRDGLNYWRDSALRTLCLFPGAMGVSFGWLDTGSPAETSPGSQAEPELSGSAWTVPFREMV